MRERTGDEGSGAASWKLEESAEAFTFRLRKEEKKKKRRRNYSKRNNELLIHRRQKAGVRIAFDVSLSFSLCTILSLKEEEKEEEESLVLLFLSYFYFAIVGRDVRIDPSFHINFRSKEIEFHREQKIFSISYFFFNA